MKYLELNFRLQPYSEVAADVLAAELAEIGCETFVTMSDGLQAYLQAECLPLSDEGQRDTTIVDTVLADFPLEDVKITYQVGDAPDEDWNAIWESSGFEPIRIDDEIYIFDDRCAEITSIVPSDVKHCVKIRPCQAFGTGSHQTTQMVIRALLHLNLQGKTIIDAGCGTGILGIVAAMCGAAKIFAYDIDEWSVRNAEENFNINDIRGDIKEILEGDASVLEKAPKADVLVANIHRNIILNDMPVFVAHLQSQAHLIISGFLKDDVEVLTNKALSLGLSLEDHFSDGEWQCLMFKNMK